MTLTPERTRRLLWCWGVVAYRRMRCLPTRGLEELANLPHEAPNMLDVRFSIKRPGRTQAQKERRRK